MKKQTPDEKLAALGEQLPPAVGPLGVYKPFLQLGRQIFVSGHGPYLPDQSFMVGKVGRDMTKEQGKEAARKTGLAILSTLKENLGSLNRIERVVKVLGMVNATEDFGEHPFVINGCSELLVEVFGAEKGIGVRSAVGMASLPGKIPVEIEAVFELKIS